MWNDILKQVQPLTVETAALCWDAEIKSLQFVNRSINLVYRFNMQSREMFLRLTHPMLRNLNELNSAIDFQRFLYQNSALICKPLKSVRGNYVEEVTQGSTIFYAHVNEGIAGEIFIAENSNKDAYIAWGESLAIFHKIAQAYQPNEQLTFKTWQELWNETDNYISKDDDVVWNEYLQISDWIKTLKNFNPKLFGLTHGDNHSGNVILSRKAAYLIDFDEPIYHWFHADIARPLINLDAQQKSKYLWFLDGYTKTISLDKTDIDVLPWFARLKNLEMYLWLKHNWLDHIIHKNEKRQPQLLNQLYNLMRDPEQIHRLVSHSV